jgi:hypothetical protein
MLESEKLAIAAHLHVLLRRKSGRVTDTEWMATNAEYAAEVVRFAHLKAAEDGHADLAEWADKLAAAMQGHFIEDTKRLGQRAAMPQAQSGSVSSGLSRYIRGLR